MTALSVKSRHVTEFHYRLEPLVSLSDGAVMGYELLAGERFCPNYDLWGWRNFYRFLTDELPKILDKVEGLIFINVSGALLLNAEIYEHLNSLPSGSGRIALEWTEHHFDVDEMSRVLVLLLKLRQRGFLLAIDDIGSGIDGMGRALACIPEFGKIDGGMLAKAREGEPETAHRYLQGMVDSLHHHDIKVIIEWIETERDLEIARLTGADFGQGYLWSKSLGQEGRD